MILILLIPHTKFVRFSIHQACLISSVHYQGLHGLERPETRKLAGWCMMSSHAGAVSVSSITLLFVWQEAMELNTHVHQNSYQYRFQKFTGNVLQAGKKISLIFKNIATRGRNRGKKSFSPSGKQAEKAERGHQNTDVFGQYKKKEDNS